MLLVSYSYLTITYVYEYINVPLLSSLCQALSIRALFSYSEPRAFAGNQMPFIGFTFSRDYLVFMNQQPGLFAEPKVC